MDRHKAQGIRRRRAGGDKHIARGEKIRRVRRGGGSGSLLSLPCPL